MKNFSVRDLAYIAMGAALIAVCSWISIPAAVPFTLQTFAVFSMLLLLGGRRGTASIAVYLLLGAMGAPVFSGFRGGIAALLGTTGGYLLGFLWTALLYWLCERRIGETLWRAAAVLICGLALCYLFGTVWFVRVYAAKSGEIGYLSALSMCVFPFLLPDAGKLALAMLLTKRIKPFIK